MNNQTTDDQTQALELAGQIVEEPDRYPEELVRVATALLLEPDSRVAREEFERLYDNARTALRFMGNKHLGWPLSKNQYYTPAELTAPGITIGREPLRGWELKLFPRDLKRHLLVTGATGTGKTNILRLIARGLGELSAGGHHPCSVVIIDRFGNFSGLREVSGQDWLVMDARECRFQLLPDRIGRQMLTALGEVRSLIKSLNTLFEAHERVSRALQRMPGTNGSPTLSHLIRAVRELDIEDSKRDWDLSCLSELNDLRRSVGSIWDNAGSEMIRRLQEKGQHTVIRTEDLDLREELHLSVHLLLSFIRSGTEGRRSHPVYVITDELQHLWERQWGSDSNMLRTLKSALLTARQPKVPVLGGLQMPDGAEPELLASAGTLISCRLRDSSNIKEVAGAVGIPHDPAHDIVQDLQVGEALYCQADRASPFRIEIPLARIREDCDEKSRARDVQSFQDSCDVRTGPEWKEVYRIICSEPEPDRLPHERSAELLRRAADSYREPPPLKKLASSAGMGRPEASRRTGWLEREGYMRTEKVSIGRRRVLLAEPTRKGFEFIARDAPSGSGRGGPGHRYCVSQVEKALQNRGYRQIKREREIGGKRIDLVARKGGKQLQAEIEMSPQNAAANAAADLKAAGPDLETIWMISPTKKMLKKVKQAVESALDDQQLKRFRFVSVSDL